MPFTPSDFTSIEAQPEDDIDKLFSRLPQVEPPDELIARILKHVRSLPGHPANAPENSLSQTMQTNIWERETLVVRNEQREPS